MDSDNLGYYLNSEFGQKVDVHRFTWAELEDRRSFLGASEIHRIMNGDWYDLYMEKTGEVEPEDLDNVFPVQLGTYTEPFNIWWLMNTHPQYFTKAQIEINQSPEKRKKLEFIDRWKWEPSYQLSLRVHPDGICTIEDEDCVVECKHVNAWSYSPEKMLERYMWQLQAQMYAWGCDHAILSVIAGNKFCDPMIVSKDEELQELMVTECKKFWEMLIRKIEPVNKDKVKANLIPEDNMRTLTSDDVRQMNCHSRWHELIPSFIQTQRSSKDFEKIKKELKDMVPDDVKYMQCGRLEAKRDKAGRITLKYDANIPYEEI